MKLKNVLVGVVICILILIVVVLLAPYLGYTYTILTNQAQGTWIGNTQSWNFIFGILVGYLFFIPLLATSFFKSKKKYLFILLIIPFIIFDLTSGLFMNFVVDAVLIVIGWLLGEGILRLYKSVSPSFPGRGRGRF